METRSSGPRNVLVERDTRGEWVPILGFEPSENRDVRPVDSDRFERWEIRGLDLQHALRSSRRRGSSGIGEVASARIEAHVDPTEPVVLMGDFNAVPTSTPIREIVSVDDSTRIRSLIAGRSRTPMNRRTRLGMDSIRSRSAGESTSSSRPISKSRMRRSSAPWSMGDRSPTTGRFASSSTSSPKAQPFGEIRSCPPMYGRSGSGTITDPSACWCISRIGIRIRGLAATVLFSE